MIIITVDYFSKWIEFKALASHNSSRFPRILINDDEPQFYEKDMKLS